MRVTVRRSGGFAGTRVTKAVDEADLSPEQAGELRQILGEAELSAAPETVDAGPHRDRFQYTVTVEADDGSRSVTAGEATAPPSLRRLIDWVMRTGRPVEPTE
jgi:hypothetical protein